ncbi:MAG TPA: ABC transporter substrate-binding protein [bacterium]|nr:ABC transporter substrate-binding protein [bacterium]
MVGGGAGYWLTRGTLGISLASAAPSDTLVTGFSFDIKTLDPGRQLENGSSHIGHATYDSLVTFDGADLTTPKPSLATGWKVSPDGKTLTFTLRRNVRFATGNPLTSADVKWSFDRVRYIKGNGAFLLNGVQDVLAPDPYSVVIQLDAPHPAILPILSSPVLGVLDSKVVTQNGGDASPDAKEKDKAEAYLNDHSAGSGPYILESQTRDQEIVLVKNPTHWRGAPSISRVVVRNIKEPATEELMLKRGDLEIAWGIGPDEARSLRQTPGVTVKTAPALNLLYVIMNNNPQVGGPFSNPKVQQAVRYALDYNGILALAGPGSVRLAGVIPTTLPGALPSSEAVKTDLDRAKQLLKDANPGDLKGQLSFSTGNVFYGVQFGIVAEKVQADLAKVGIQITLDGLPSSIALQKYRDAKDQLGIWAWAADYPDVSDYLVFVPGRTVGKRAGWPADASPDTQALADLATKAETEIDNAKRVSLYQQVNRKIAEIGPFAPMFQPVAPYAFRSTLRGVVLASTWFIDYTTVKKG